MYINIAHQYCQANRPSIPWATSWQNLLLPYANNKGADHPAHPRSLISTFVVHCLDSITPLVTISKISSLYLASLAAQAGLCLTWSKIPKTGFLVTRPLSLRHLSWDCRYSQEKDQNCLPVSVRNWEFPKVSRRKRIVQYFWLQVSCL